MRGTSLNYNFYNTLIFSGIIYGLVFTFFTFLSGKHKSKAKNYLLLTVISLTLSNLQYWLIDVGFREMFKVPKIIYVQFELLILPFFYLFIKNYLQIKLSKLQVLLLFVPFIMGMSYQFIMYSQDLPLSILRKYNLIVEIATILYSLLLIVLIFFELYKYEKNQKKLKNKNIGINTKWLRYTMITGIIVFILWMLNTQIFYRNDLTKLDTYYSLWIGISIIIYWIGNKGLIELRIYYERRKIREAYFSIEHNSHPFNHQKTKGIILFKRFINDLDNEKLFLMANLSLNELANKYGVSSGYISQIINNYSKESLTELVNKRRVDEAKQMLRNKNFNQYTIESIALESGFSTKTNFYKVFKNLVGMTPNKYKKVQNI